MVGLIFFLDKYFSYDSDLGDKKLIISTANFKNKKIENILNLDKILLANVIDWGTNKKNSSIYQIYNFLDTNKKLYFLLALIETVLNKK